MSKSPSNLQLGAHVSIAGGVEKAPARGAEIGAAVIQIFTKQVQRWAERTIDPAVASAFRRSLAEHGITVAGSHDSYLINLASPDRALRRRSLDSFRRELERCHALGLDFLATHPGNATDGDRAAALSRNAEAVRRALEADEEGQTVVLFENTAGQGTALGWRFEELAELLEAVGAGFRNRVGVCLDTAHTLAAGYDLASDYDGVLRELDRTIGLDRVKLFHLNDSKTALGSRVDRHEHLGRGHLGREPFQRLMLDRRFLAIPKIIETPKGDDPVRFDRRNLRFLRRCANSA